MRTDNGCQTIGCTEACGYHDRPMCGRHWTMVPLALRLAMWREERAKLRTGQCLSYLMAVQRAVNHVAVAEGIWSASRADEAIRHIEEVGW